MKYIVVAGGVVSGLGKGIASSSIGVVLQQSGLHVTSIKIDPYLNTDAGTMSPYEHGEVYVLDDGGETDLDIGNYERFLNLTLTKDHNITTGKIFGQVINRERKGDYLGKTVQMIPHVTDAIQEWIERVSYIPVDDSKQTPDVCIIELGGTVGDIESMIYLEALRQFRYRVGQDNLCLVFVSLVPTVGAVGEPKSKPTQNGVKELRSAGLTPDIILCRSSVPLSRDIVGKISQFCMVPVTHVISVHDVSNIFKVPVLLCEARVPSLLMSCLRFNKLPADDVPNWRKLSEKVDQGPVVRIGVIGKYTGLSDSYLSITKSLEHGALANNVNLKLVWIDSSHLESASKDKKPEKYEHAWSNLNSVDGILIPGGFGDRGVEGKISAVQYARENKIPFLGICLGMQVSVIEYSRNVLGIKDATSAEFDAEAENPVIVFMPEISTTHLGGTMRLGSRPSLLSENSLARQLYNGQSLIHERHRHRYEVNPDYIARLENVGLIFSGRDDKGIRMECIEIDDHPFFFAVQYHPEFKSRPFNPSPPFVGFIQAAAGMFKRKDTTKRSIAQHANNNNDESSSRRNSGSDMEAKTQDE